MKFLFKLCISVALLFLIFRDIDFAVVPSLIFSYSPLVLLEIIGLHVAVFTVAAIKWQTFLPEQTLSKLFRFTIIGQFYAVILPGQLLSEAAKAYRFAAGESEKHRIAASVAIDKITGLAGLLIVAIVGFSFTSTNFLGDWQMVIITSLFVVLGVIFSLRFNVVISIILKYVPFSSRLSPLILSYHEYAKDTKCIIRGVLLGIVSQLLSILITIIFAQALGITIGLFDWFWIFGLVSVVVLIPVTIAGLGLREGTFVSLLGFFAIPPAHALTLSLSIFGAQVVVGLCGAILEGHEWFQTRGKMNIQTKI